MGSIAKCSCITQNISQEDLEDVGSIMNMFQTTFAQRSGQKRKRSEQFLNASVKVSAKKIEDVVQRQG